MIKEVDDYLDGINKWQSELRELRAIILECGLTEAFKWKHPCYTYKNKNIVLLHGFKEYCAILFYKGALLKDPNNLLIQQTQHTQSGRQIRFTHVGEIQTLRQTIKDYILEAAQNEESGKKVQVKKVTDYPVPKELTQKFSEDPNLETAFNSLTPGRQKGYLLHFSQPKQSNTRSNRISKNTQRILNGKGLNDCTCGLSKRMPNCDGSHKQL
ncbi:Uncharacterized conserved protein YdeI, YjbR/CyaY-like superfamily, DUF1801 family [Maribacter sedimenticola]|uniref:Uncharacterized conserved protein YdeI, YjbR/CyaY-like superfamily, DUF1801 family n=1 Tax=Maribacter sedimenticola TaxID=228956 RepID=A0ABY1SDI7_9FLAO|nr:DUF1801 domain-containing protein [Maribacter sedimenticola]SNR27190.1 Uncharacterized conserved protein YdeI, YjbR/CyaY-like superfamily, DUF1801 family [Maribacter sedimenticola]